jgi:putative transposase
MARPLRIEYPGAFYHITSRGNERQKIFRSLKDRERFLTYLESATQRYGAVIHVYCLMSNHYHLLLETPRGNLSQIMRHINGAYTTYFNVRLKRVGHLFQGRYKAILVEVDEYALELSRYIHLNPVRAKMVSRPEEYFWSSYRVYTGREQPSDWLMTSFILNYFDRKNLKAKNSYKTFVEELLEQEYHSPMREVIASTILGSPEFVEKVSRENLDARKDGRNVPAMKILRPCPDMDEILIKVKAESISERQARKITIYCCHKFSGAKLKEIGEKFGLTEAAVSQTSRRLVSQARQDEALKELLDRLEKKICVKN